MDTSLEQFVQDVSGENYLRVQDDLGNGYVRLRPAEAQRRQAQQDIRSFENVVIELLRNSRDAHARAIFVASWTEGATRHATVLDDGDGIPCDKHELVFEPFVTSKLDSFHADKWGVHGRGMALYSIRQNVQSARIVASDVGLGSVFSIVSDMRILPEKRDQSSVPRIVIDDNGNSVLRGPHNIIRTVMEFSIEERSRISVYYGSCASIVSTLYHLGTSAISHLSSVLASCDDSVPYIYRFAYVADADSLTRLADSLGLPISSRTAFRILNGEIEPLPVHLELLASAPTESKPNGIAASSGSSRSTSRQSARSIKFDERDLIVFHDVIMNGYRQLAQAYYLDSDVEIALRTKGDEMVITIPIHQVEPDT